MPNPSDYIALGSQLEEDSEETEEEQEEEWFIPVMESPWVLAEKESKNGEATVCSNAGESGENSQGNEWNRGDIDGLFCPICMEAWTTTGDHHVWSVHFTIRLGILGILIEISFGFPLFAPNYEFLGLLLIFYIIKDKKN